MIDICSLEELPLLSVETAIQRVCTAISAIDEQETLPLRNALGRVLAETIYSPIALPQARNSAMDGYAFSSLDKTDEQAFCLQLVGVSYAGKPFQGQLQTGQCIRIFTGAVLPDFTDSVIMQEQVETDQHTVYFPEQTKIQQHVRQIGEDVAQGSVLCAAGKKLTAEDLALLASAGISEVAVKRKVRIAIFSTGDELISLGQPLATGQIYDSNRYLLLGLLFDPCYQVTDFDTLPDNKNRIQEQFINAAKHYDVIISTGGASVGEADYIKQILTECGTVNFWKIAIKPGKPLTFGTIENCYFFGLPGNPVSVHVTFQQIVAPALQQLSGTLAMHSLQLTALCTTPLKKSVGRKEYQRGILSQTINGDLMVASAGRQGSNLLKTLSSANCYIVLAENCAGVAVGDPVQVEPFIHLINNNLKPNS